MFICHVATWRGYNWKKGGKGVGGRLRKANLYTSEHMTHVCVNSRV